ncbi:MULTISPECIES: hypothetical protein [unclassified Mesorhizobium]|uniref:hypothetical protein n=1 Tax=unclassified Mesorhizobium TaxID=325217 RepID=UPI000FCC8265|nr:MULTISPECIES: hypothetical protein [unclassified Mesorhizobium]RUV99354.1 hypothetical protein EOA49_20145 [Mesorhizobium sp. M1A.F.Ca.IN.020.04.1.1]RUW16295.1 hypothetical protein EOA53_00660 [Mesorhizobium sp. M1A.F.Ca.IN.020.03.1.1]RWF75288.1 MAG: hypothetical protein EOQ34_02250 [Mesorhizobium sp.]RWG15835.1 MAG: hypothetical protein EOQ58_10510 [Mesorhizobium sp.]RWG31411.1 MAG: hypothetical protein EOQ61_13445 [Mesorhizobium sp.]
MDDPQLIDITEPNHVASVWRYIATIEVLEALKKVPDFQRVPGFSLALALVEKEVAEDKAESVQRNLRAVAATGVDVSKVQRVELEIGPNASLRLKVVMMDLADLAGGGS